MNKKNWLVGLVAMTSMVLTACGAGGEDTSESAAAGGSDGVIKVGTLAAMDHPSMMKAQDGFIQALADNGYKDGEKIKLDILSAQGSQSNLNPMAQQVTEDNDLVLSLGTGTTQALASVEKEKPIIFAAVTDPVAAGVVKSNEEPGGNITGSSDAMPVDKQIELLLSLDKDAKKVGVIYNSSEANSSVQAKEAIDTIEAAGLEAVVTTVTSTNDVQQNLSSIANDIDLLYIPTDNTVASTIPTVHDITVEHKIPTVMGAAEMVEAGGLATYGIDYTSLGYQAGEMAVDVLEGKADPATMPVQTAKEYTLIVNEEVAKEIGVNPDDIVAPE